MTLATENGKEFALKALDERRANKPQQKDNALLPAGAPMYFYCRCCGNTSDILPESYTCRPKHICDECESLKELGWLEK